MRSDHFNVVMYTKGEAVEGWRGYMHHWFKTNDIEPNDILYWPPNTDVNDEPGLVICHYKDAAACAAAKLKWG